MKRMNMKKCSQKEVKLKINQKLNILKIILIISKKKNSKQQGQLIYSEKKKTKMKNISKKKMK